MIRSRRNASFLENFPYLTKWMMPNANYLSFLCKGHSGKYSHYFLLVGALANVISIITL